MYIIVRNITDGANNVQLVNMTEQNTGCIHDYTLTTNDMKKISIFIIGIVAVTLLLTAKEAVIRRILRVAAVWIIAITLDQSVGILVEILLSKAAYAQLRLEQKWMIFSLISICGLSFIYWIQKKRLLEKSKVFQALAKGSLYICIAIMMVALPLTVTGLDYLGREINNPALTSKLQILTDIFLFSMIALAIFIIYVNIVYEIQY